jgi:hypothetical protein
MRSKCSLRREFLRIDHGKHFENDLSRAHLSNSSITVWSILILKGLLE